MNYRLRAKNVLKRASRRLRERGVKPMLGPTTEREVCLAIQDAHREGLRHGAARMVNELANAKLIPPSVPGAVSPIYDAYNRVIEWASK